MGEQTLRLAGKWRPGGRWTMVGAALLLSACAAGTPVGSGAGRGDERASHTQRPYVSAHRGGAAYAPENTMLAYENAARLGVDDFETDMLLTADGVPVLMHDDTLDRTTDCSGAVAGKTYAEIQRCDAAYWWSPGQSTTAPDAARVHPLRGKGIRVPTVQALFDFAAGFQGAYAPTVTIEIKIARPAVEGASADGLQAAQALVPLIHDSGIAARIIVQSFDAQAIDAIKRLDSTIKTLFLSETSATDALDTALAGGHEVVSPAFQFADLTAPFVDAAHASGKRVVPWTADREADIRALIDKRVDGIITNYPACLLAMQGRLATRELVPAQAGNVEVKLCK